MPRASKGDRDSFVTRPPRAVGDEVRLQAAESNMSISDFIARLLAIEVGLPDLAPEPPRRDQEELPMTG